MPRVAETTESLNTKVGALNTEITQFEKLRDDSPVDSVRDFFESQLAQKVEVRDRLEESLRRKSIEAISDKYRDGVKTKFGTVNVTSISPSIPSFPPHKIEELLTENDQRIVELQDRAKVYRKASTVISGMELSEKELKDLPRFSPSVDGQKVTMTLSKKTGVFKSRPRSPMIITSIEADEDSPVYQLCMGGQIHGDHVLEGPYYGSWAKLARTLYENGHIDDESWSKATETKDGKNRSISYRDFLTSYFTMTIEPLDSYITDEDGDEDEDEGDED